MKRAAPGRSGFTLVEVVVALALGALLTMGVQSLTVNAYRISTRIEKESAQIAARSFPFELLQQDLSSLPAGGGLRLRDGILTFSTLNSMQSQRIAARHAVALEYRIVKVGNNLVQISRWEGELETEPTLDARVVLAGDLQAAEFAVFDGRKWQTIWPPSVPQLAAAVRLAVTWRDGIKDERIIPLAQLRRRRHDE